MWRAVTEHFSAAFHSILFHSAHCQLICSNSINWLSNRFSPMSTFPVTCCHLFLFLPSNWLLHAAYITSVAFHSQWSLLSRWEGFVGYWISGCCNMELAAHWQPSMPIKVSIKWLLGLDRLYATLGIGKVVATVPSSWENRDEDATAAASPPPPAAAEDEEVFNVFLDRFLKGLQWRIKAGWGQDSVVKTAAERGHPGHWACSTYDAPITLYSL